MACDVPDEGGQFTGDGDADFVLLHAAALQSAVAGAQAQLGAPGDVADDLGLALLAHLQFAGEPGREAVRSRRPRSGHDGRGRCRTW